MAFSCTLIQNITHRQLYSHFLSALFHHTGKKTNIKTDDENTIYSLFTSLVFITFHITCVGFVYHDIQKMNRFFLDMVIFRQTLLKQEYL